MIRGYLKFEKSIPVQSGLRVMIVVEDTSRIDADSVQVAQTFVTLPDNFDFEHKVLPFEIDVNEDIDSLTVRAHMPAHSGTDIRVGDMMSMETIPVLQDKDIVMTLRHVE